LIDQRVCCCFDIRRLTMWFMTDSVAAAAVCRPLRQARLWSTTSLRLWVASLAQRRHGRLAAASTKAVAGVAGRIDQVI